MAGRHVSLIGPALATGSTHTVARLEILFTLIHQPLRPEEYTTTETQQTHASNQPNKQKSENSHNIKGTAQQIVLTLAAIQLSHSLHTYHTLLLYYNILQPLTPILLSATNPYHLCPLRSFQTGSSRNRKSHPISAHPPTHKYACTCQCTHTTTHTHTFR